MAYAIGGEAFFIIKGQIKIEYKDRTVNLKEGDFYVEPNPPQSNSCYKFLLAHAY